MNSFHSKILTWIFVVLTACFAAHAQSSESKKKKALNITEKVAVITLKAAANATFETAKFIGKNVLVPATKEIVIPIASTVPPLAAKGVKLAAKGVRNGVEAVWNNGEKEFSRPTSTNSDATGEH
jgi:hypothetical protein